MFFRDRLVATLHAIRPVLAEPGVLIVGSEVPNLLAPNPPAQIVISKDVDVGVAVGAHGQVKGRLAELRGLRPSPEEPSVWAPEGDLLEVNFVGIDPALTDPTESYVLEDPQLPLLVFGALSLLRPAPSVDVEGLAVPVPEPAGLLLEKLLTDRRGEKGDRDLLVALALMDAVGAGGSASQREELARTYAKLSPDLRHQVRSNLTLLSLLPSRDGMPAPWPRRGQIAALLRQLEQIEEKTP